MTRPALTARHLQNLAGSDYEALAAPARTAFDLAIAPGAIAYEPAHNHASRYLAARDAAAAARDDVLVPARAAYDAAITKIAANLTA